MILGSEPPRTITPIAKEAAMPCSEARIAANKANSLKSTGPSPEGRLRSRRNGLKHGLTGKGTVIAKVDQAEVDRRAAALRAQMAPRSEAGLVLVGQIALLSVRMERCAAQEMAATAKRVRHAGDDFDQEQYDRAEELLDALAEDPRGTVRRLRRTPEGVEALVGAWAELRERLTREPRPVWT